MKHLQFSCLKRFDAFPRNTFFTADTHFGHNNIIRYCERPFRDSKEMDEEIIKRWNSRIKPGDLVFHVGDVIFHRKAEDLDIINRLNGVKHLILGNHDAPESLYPYFETISEIATVRVRKNSQIQRIVLCHYAMRTWDQSHRGAWHLYGHTHGKLEENNSLSMDCGVDTNDFYPYSYSEIKARMEAK